MHPPLPPTPPLAYNCLDRPYNDPGLITAQVLTLVSLFCLWTNKYIFGAAMIPFLMMQVGKRVL